MVRVSYIVVKALHNGDNKDDDDDDAMGFTYNMLNQSINNVNYNHAQYPKGDALPNSRYRTSHSHASSFQATYFKIQSAHFIFAHHAPL